MAIANPLHDKIVVITGGSRGLGKSLTLEFLRAGAMVATCSRHPDTLMRTLGELPEPARVLGVTCDVRELEPVRALADAAEKKFGRIDVWINNAGVAHPYQKMIAVDIARWRESFDTNFLGTYHGARVALEKMLRPKSGRIINILGIGVDRPAPNQSGYGASKAAVWQLTQTLALEYAASGVDMCAAQPGMIWTEMLTRAEGVDLTLQLRFEWAMRVFGNSPETPARFIRQIAARKDVNGKMFRMVTPRMFVPRMIREMLGAGRRNPRPWEKLAG